MFSFASRLTKCKTLMKETILVTGGTGFIGSHTVVELQQAGYNVVIIDNLSNSKADVVDGIEKITGIRPAFENVDCCDMKSMENVFNKYNSIKGIIHFAASKAVGESVQKPLLYYRNNILSLINLLELMSQHGVKGIIFSSSCTVYGQPSPENLPVTENAPIQKALSPYGNTKQINEEIIQDYIHSGAPIKSIILRYFNPIGAHPTAHIGELPNGVPMNLIPFVTQTAIGIRKQLKIFGNDYNTPDGTCIRDYIYVVDLAKAHVKAMERILEDKGTDSVEIFNIGTGRGVSTLEVVEGFEKATGVKVNWEYAPRREGDIEKVWADPAKANNVLGWKAETSLEDTLRSAWKWQVKLDEENKNK
ncbi:uDP-glucose 4-epimerase [Prevotella sp. CAG:1058]|nr:uDP-glucose 4-epimerase [Prevotella sp. CAG:1058]